MCKRADLSRRLIVYRGGLSTARWTSANAIVASSVQPSPCRGRASVKCCARTGNTIKHDVLVEDLKVLQNPPCDDQDLEHIIIKERG
jgi:hypothetical protein